MDATTYTGNGSTQSITNVDNGTLGFQPDFVWIKVRSTGYSHRLVDSNRGATKLIYSDLTNSESTDATSLTSFNTNGFSLGSAAGTNESGQTFVAWQWKAGGAAVTNTNGSTTTQVSVNQTAGFSIVTYTGTGSNMTIGHGLGQAPKVWFWKNRSATSNWSFNYYFLYNSMRFLLLNTPDSQGDNSASYWGNPPTSTVNYIGAADPATNINGQQFVMYAFAEVPGYSKINSYVGNGSSDGTFIYTGFRPKYVLIKAADRYEDWHVHDTTRNPSNLANCNLYPSLANAESTTDNQIDILSNGFKLRSTNTGTNNSGTTYIYMAFAENPFKYANAR